jgi:hypothetical protein
MHEPQTTTTQNYTITISPKGKQGTLRHEAYDSSGNLIGTRNSKHRYEFALVVRSKEDPKEEVSVLSWHKAAHNVPTKMGKWTSHLVIVGVATFQE